MGGPGVPTSTGAPAAASASSSRYVKALQAEAARIYKLDHLVTLVLGKPLMPGNVVGLEVAKARAAAVTKSALSSSGHGDRRHSHGTATGTGTGSGTSSNVQRVTALQL